MFKLENDTAWTEDLKNAFKHGITHCQINIKSNTTEEQESVINTPDFDENTKLVDAELIINRNTPNVGFIGSTVAKKLTVNLQSIDDDIPNMENQEIDFRIGADYNGDTYFINYGNFIVDKAPKNDDTNGKVSFTAYDYMIKFNKPYNPGTIFPCTLYNMLVELCTQAGVTLGSLSITNGNFMVENNQFKEKSCREVLQYIGQCAFSWAYIGQDNKLYLDFTVKDEEDVVDTITKNEYYSNKFKMANEYYGPIDKVTYGQMDIQGQEESYPSNETVAQHELIIYDNLFAYTTAKRHELIQAGSVLIGLKYMPIQELELCGLVYLDNNDYVEVQDMDGNSYYTYVLNHTIRYNGAVGDTIASEAQSLNEQAYFNTKSVGNQRTEIIVDRANGEINLIAEKTTDLTNPDSLASQTAALTVRVGNIESAISDIGDITTSGDSQEAVVTLEGINESEPVTLQVHPNSVSIEYLHPRATGLYPSSTLYLKNRSIRFTKLSQYNQTTDTNYTSYKKYYEKNNNVYTLLVAGTDYTVGDTISGTVYENPFFDYEIPGDLLYYDNENYDEFYLDYNTHTCQITKKCGYNADGTVYKLTNSRIDIYTYPTILLDDGDYEISLPSYNYGYLFARLMSKNIYTDQFYTKVQTNSLINQTASDINISVGQTLENYSTKTETQTAITAGINNFDVTVKRDYATKNNLNDTASTLQARINLKVNTADLISEINASADVITLNAGRLVINGGNFRLDSYGNMTCTNGNFSGTITSTSGTIGGWTIGANSISATNSRGNRVTLADASDTYQNFLIVRTGTGTTANPYQYPFYVRGDGTLYAEKATIGSSGSNRKINMLDGDITTTNNDGYKGVVVGGQSIDIYSYNSANNLVGTVGSWTVNNRQLMAVYAHAGDALDLGYYSGHSADTSMRIDASSNNNGIITVYKKMTFDNAPLYVYELRGTNGTIYLESPLFTAYQGNTGHTGYPMIGTYFDHKYYCGWDDSNLNFYVDNTWVGDLSDRRLKKEIELIQPSLKKSQPEIEKLINAIDKCQLYKFKADNRNGLISVGIMAQELIKACEEEKINPLDYKILQEIQYKLDEEEKYYTIDYTQYLLLKNEILQRKLNNLESEIEQIKETLWKK